MVPFFSFGDCSTIPVAACLHPLVSSVQTFPALVIAKEAFRYDAALQSLQHPFGQEEMGVPLAASQTSGIFISLLRCNLQNFTLSEIIIQWFSVALHKHHHHPILEPSYQSMELPRGPSAATLSSHYQLIHPLLHILHNSWKYHLGAMIFQNSHGYEHCEDPSNTVR